MNIATTNDAVLHDAMMGRNARKDRDKLSVLVYLYKMKVTFDHNYMPTFATARTSTTPNSTPPSKVNYDNAMESFEFYVREMFHDLASQSENIRQQGHPVYASARKNLESYYQRLVTRHGENFFKTVAVEGLLTTDFPEKVTPEQIMIWG